VLREERAPLHRVSRRIQNAHVPAARTVFERAARKEGAHHAGQNNCPHERAASVAPDIRAELRDQKSVREINERIELVYNFYNVHFTSEHYIDIMVLTY